MTLAQWEALEERRVIAIRHERFNAALFTAAYMNSHREEGSRALSPFDFIAGFETDPEDDRKAKLRQQTKDNIRIAFAETNCKTIEEAKALKARMIERMTQGGVLDPDDIFREVFPEL